MGIGRDAPGNLVDKDYEQDPAIHTAVDAAMKEYTLSEQDPKATLEPIQVRVAKRRKEIAKQLYEFKESFHSGYQVLLDELAKTVEAANKEENPLAVFELNQKKLEALEDEKGYTEKILSDTPLSEIMGFSHETLTKFYEAAVRIMEKNEMHSSRDAFHFLVTIAPHYSYFWLGLGFSLAKCGDKERALRVCEHATELAPNDADNYIITAEVFREFNEVSHAREICDRALAHAESHKNEPWAGKLQDSVQAAKYSLQG